MPMTLAEKIIARATGRSRVTPGEVVTAKVDLAMIHDSGGPRRVAPILKRLGVGLWDKDRVVLISDHYVGDPGAESHAILELTREWARRTGVRFHDAEGICHVVLPQSGHIGPGMFVVGGDSHSPTGGAFGAYMFGVGSTEMAGVLATGEIWIKVPETILIEWTGQLGPGVCAKDIMLSLCGRMGMDGGRYQAVQYTGSAISALNMPDRMTISNMTAELGGQTGLIAPDAKTADFLLRAGANPDGWRDWAVVEKSAAGEHHVFDASTLPPHVAAPHSPANSAPIGDYGDQPVDVVYIGACTGAKYTDLKAAATILKTHKPATGVQILVAPASRLDQQRARADGTLEILEDAGARILPNACGICAGYGSARLGADVRCISTTARNFRGRMGEASSRVWLASPYTAAASAITGRITDPRSMMEDA
ncbi:MAG: 3-isopropylmalate dehydratase large subunit [Halocynthiibacter sp.]